MVRVLVAAAALATLVAAGTALGPAAAVADVGPVAMDADTQSVNGTAPAGPAPGAQLAGLVGASDATVRGSVDREAFGTRLADADSPPERAAVVDRHLGASERRVSTLERELDDLPADEAAGDSGTGGGQTTVAASRATARAAAVGSAAAAEQRLLEDLEAAASELPRDAREHRELARRLDRLDDRLATLRERTRGAVRVVDGADGARPSSGLASADVDAAAGRALDDGGRLRGVVGSERIDLHVRLANGSTDRYAVHTDDGRVQRVEPGVVEAPTVRVYATADAVRTVRDAEDPIAALRTAREQGRVSYDGVGLRGSAKFGAVSAAEFLADLL